ncbi:hypothetical protein Q5H92_22970 [Hymenobacter sp. M29]|uniref:TIGR04255 family protein n=1 Tax=Hymenobacter mellowenesis TaxID=3063995 RepID=A0ABT9AJE0_9BACT|nr:hypothetical protein [Hymenobacter sp. M29]MDO7849245.1 hypothetical protein [Hymenobacter sp. M29]
MDDNPNLTLGQLQEMRRDINSTDISKLYFMPALPFPTVAEYQAELKPFTDADWQVEFVSPKDAPFVCIFQGHNPRYNMNYRVHVDTEARAVPDLMRQYLQEIWRDLRRDVDKKFSFPEMMVYKQSWTHKPTDWNTLAAILGMQPGPIDRLRDELQKPDFRRLHQIVIGSPFKDALGDTVYEHDVVELAHGRGKLELRFDEQGGEWWAHDLIDGIRRVPNAVSDGYRVARINTSGGMARLRQL